MKAEAFRDDLAVRALAGVPVVRTHAPYTFGDGGPLFRDAVLDGGNWRRERSTDGGATWAVAFTTTISDGECDATGNAFIGFEDSKVARFGRLELSEAQYVELIMLRGGCTCSWPTTSPPCLRCTEPPSFAEADELGWLDEEPETINFAGQFDALADMIPAHSAIYAAYADHVRGADVPGIADMAAKSVQPTPEPVLSIGGQKVTERELAQALRQLREKDAPVVKETPRGLMCVRDFDHRLGAWNEA
jgi:hypothetical protein